MHNYEEKTCSAFALCRLEMRTSKSYALSQGASAWVRAGTASPAERDFGVTDWPYGGTEMLVILFRWRVVGIASAVLHPVVIKFDWRFTPRSTFVTAPKVLDLAMITRVR